MCKFQVDGGVMDLTHNHVEDTEELGRLPSGLHTLILRRNRIRVLTRNITVDAITLKHLDLYDNGLNEVEELPPNLIFLDLSFNKISKVAYFPDTLTELYLASNQLKSIPDLTKLTKLRILELGDNQIDALDTAILPRGLQELYLGKNLIKEIPDLTEFTELRILTLQGNRLESVRSFGKVIVLEELYLGENMITSFEGQLDLPKLRLLDLSQNRLSSFELQSDTLQELWLDHNQLNSWSNLKLKLSNLITIYMRDNGLSRTAGYQERLQEMLPSLKHIDN